VSEFNLDALEKVLSPKGRQLRQSLSLKPAKSKQALYDEGKKLAKELYDVYAKKVLRTRYQGESYYIHHYTGLLYRNEFDVDVNSVPIQVLENLVNNGNLLLKDYHNMIDTLVIQLPELALEANLEEKSGSEVLRYIYFKRLDELDKIVKYRILSPEANIYITFDMWFESPAPQSKLTVTGWLHQGRMNIDGIELYPKNPTGVSKLIYFLTNFDKVVDQVNKQIDKIKIKKIE
jgi:hypothetical protein